MIDYRKGPDNNQIRTKAGTLEGTLIVPIEAQSREVDACRRLHERLLLYFRKSAPHLHMT